MIDCLTHCDILCESTYRTVSDKREREVKIPYLVFTFAIKRGKEIIHHHHHRHHHHYVIVSAAV